jgi:hypothetical protein
MSTEPTDIDDGPPPAVNVAADCPTPECHIERCVKAEIAKALAREPANSAKLTDDPDEVCQKGALVMCELIGGQSQQQRGNAKIGACGVRPDTVTARLNIVVKVFGCNADTCEADRIAGNIRFIFLSSKFARMYKARRLALERLGSKKDGFQQRGEQYALTYTDTPRLIDPPGK